MTTPPQTVSEEQAKVFRDLDARLLKVAQSVKILSSLSWSPTVTKDFLQQYNSGNPVLPTFEPQTQNFTNQKAELRDILKRCDREHPIGNYLFDTAKSYLVAAELLENVGKPIFTKLSAELYGLPSDPIDSGGLTILQAADHLIDQTKDFIALCALANEECCLLPEYVAAEIQREVNSFFHKHKVDVIVDAKLSAKAAASARRIRVRKFTCFSPYDIPQLLHHEAFVHTLTGINGQGQPQLKIMSLDSPRVAATQEGLAVFAELITNSMDLHRLRRISLRVKAIEMAINGADFLDIFRFFLDAGQNDLESCQSAARIFRGGNVRGTTVFTKDNVYLRGFVLVHSFLHRAMLTEKVSYPSYLVSGKLHVNDVAALEPFFISGYIGKPIYQPRWITNRSSLLAFLLYSALAMELRLLTPRLTENATGETIF